MPCPASPLCRACRSEAACFAATGVPRLEAASFDAEEAANGASRRGGLDGRYRRVRDPVWPLWLSPDRSDAAHGGLGGERLAHLAAGWAQSAAEAPKKGRLWLNDGSYVRLRPEHPSRVWSYDFVEDRTHDGRKLGMLNVIDEFTRECVAIRTDPQRSQAQVDRCH